MKKRRAQAGATGSLVALIAIFILIYILLIPPDLRDELLNGDGSSASKDPDTETPGTVKYEKTVLEVTPGRIDYLKFKEYEHPLPSVNLYSETAAKEAKIADSVYLKNGIFDKKIGEARFRIDNLDNLGSIMLNFRLNPNRNSNGRLVVRLNSNEILSYDPEDKQSLDMPIKLNRAVLEESNYLTAEVEGVGWKFWTTNEYELDDLTLFYEETDASTQTSKNVFMVTDSEKFNMESAYLKFSPDCSPSSAGKLNVYMNRELIFSSVPDCGQLNRIDFSTSLIEAGTNRLTFESEKGRYLIDQIMVYTKLQSMTYPVYYFDIDKALFSQTIGNDDVGKESCGEVDGVCPKNCDMDVDKDCCFEKSSNYWCDYQPDNLDDRCRAVTGISVCALCKSGYEDYRGNPPETCENMCGDDTDNKCPQGCSKYYDKDCCFEENEENFWCDDIPKYGLATCKDALTTDECDACYAGWESEESGFECPDDSKAGDAVLRSRYDVKLTLKFADDSEKKAGKIFINGYQFHFYTYDDEYSRNIDSYVEDNTNSIKIEPDQTVLDIRSLLVEIIE